MENDSPVKEVFCSKIGRLMHFVLAALFMASCASQQALKPPPVSQKAKPSVVEERNAIESVVEKKAVPQEKTSPPLDQAKEFSLILQVHPATSCAQPGGPEIFHLGAEHKLGLVIRFDYPVAQLLDPGKLYAKIDGIERTLPFHRRVSQWQIVSDVADMETLLPENRKFGPSRVEIFYDLKSESVYLGYGGLLAFDTVAPPTPGSPAVEDVKNEEFTVEWSIIENGDAEDVKEFVIEKSEGSSWRPVASASGSPPYRAKVPAAPNGSFRVVSVDCAGNRSFAEFFPSLIRVSSRGCGPTKKAAYEEAKRNLVQMFLEEHTYPWLAQNSGIGPKKWVPDRILHPTTTLEAADPKKSGGVYCATISESIDREFFQAWIARKTRAYIEKGKNTVVIEPVGPGAGMFADIFKSRAAGEGYKVYDANDRLDFSPNYRLRIEVDPGRPNHMTGSEQYCWHVKVRIDFRDLTKNRRIPFTHKEVEDLDPRIYASDRDPEPQALQKAIDKAGGNGLHHRVAEPMINDLFRRINGWQ